MTHRIFDKSVFEKELEQVKLTFRKLPTNNIGSLALTPDDDEKIIIYIDNKKIIRIESTRKRKRGLDDEKTISK